MTTALTGGRLTIQEAAARYGIHKRTIWELIRVKRLLAKQGLDPHHDRVVWLIHEDDLERLAAERGWTRKDQA